MCASFLLATLYIKHFYKLSSAFTIQCVCVCSVQLSGGCNIAEELFKLPIIPIQKTLNCGVRVI